MGHGLLSHSAQSQTLYSVSMVASHLKSPSLYALSLSSLTWSSSDKCNRAGAPLLFLTGTFWPVKLVNHALMLWHNNSTRYSLIKCHPGEKQISYNELALSKTLISMFGGIDWKSKEWPNRQQQPLHLKKKAKSFNSFLNFSENELSYASREEKELVFI